MNVLYGALVVMMEGKIGRWISFMCWHIINLQMFDCPA